MSYELSPITNNHGDRSIGYGPPDDSYTNIGYSPDYDLDSKTPQEDCDNNSQVRDDKEEEGGNWCSNGVFAVQQGLNHFLTQHTVLIWQIIKAGLLLAYFGYFAYCMYYKFGDEGSYRLLGCTLFGFVLLLWKFTGRYIIPFSHKVFSGLERRGERCRFNAKLATRWFLYFGMVVYFAVYTGYVIGRQNPRNLVSVSGIAAFTLLLFIFSKNPAKVNWHPVFWGLSIQYTFACLILETKWGFEMFQWLGDRITELLNYSNAGAEFLFGSKYIDHPFAFKVLPVIVYFSTMISILYYLGVMQFLITGVGKFLAFCLGTSATESLNAAGNIFVGQTESPLMIRPFMKMMTKSELHAVMTGGFATVAGSTLGAYASYGVPANHLLAASVMSAPAALAMSKLFYPETESSDIDEERVYKMEKGAHRNVIEAASDGASTSIKLVANVAVNVMAFLAILEFVNATLTWFGDRCGIDNLTFQFICSYVFYPISFVMGVDPFDCRRVAKLIGYKTFTNEFVAYIRMGDLIQNKVVFSNYTTTFNNSNWHYDGEDLILDDWNKKLEGGILMPRSEVIATYALCGFSNLGSMGIQLGGLGAMAPSRKGHLSDMVLRAMIAGNVACFLTAAIAGLFYKEFE